MSNLPQHQHKFDRTKALKLRIQGLSYENIGTLLGVSAQSVAKALKKMGGDQMEDRAAFQAHKAEVLETLQYRVVTSIKDTDIEKMSVKDRMLGIGILHDKIRLERNQSTANHSVQVLSRAIRDATNNG